MAKVESKTEAIDRICKPFPLSDVRFKRLLKLRNVL